MTSTKLLYHQKETLHDLSFNFGFRWALLSSEAQDRIMDAIGGSRGRLEKTMLWAEEFDMVFETKCNTVTEANTYLEDIDKFFAEKWGEFIAGHVADRMAEGTNQGEPA